MRNLARLGSVLVGFALLAGCGTGRHPAAGQPPEFQAGYSDGCSSGNVAAGHPYYRFTKNAETYEARPLYRQGWDNGFAVCKGNYEAIGRALR